MQSFLRSLEIIDMHFKLEIDTVLAAKEWTPEIMSKLVELWNNEYLLAIFENNSLMPLLNIEHYLNSPQILIKQDSPKEKDLIICKGDKKLGVTESEILVQGMDFCFYEFNELKKKKIRTKQRWYPYFDTVSLIIYFVSLEGYDIPLRNDPQMTQLEESFQIWKQLVSTPSFMASDTILFFTKSDSLFLNRRSNETLQRNPYLSFQI